MSNSEQAARGAIVSFLEDQGWSVRDASAGQGVPKRSRLIISREGEQIRCLVKFSTSGRISFTRNAEGSYTLLDEFDHVIHMQPLANADGLHVAMFKSEVIKEAFARNYLEMVENGGAHLPQWLNPQFELGWRFVGSGYESAKIWSADIAYDGQALLHANSEVDNRKEEHRSSLIEDVKCFISSKTGVPTQYINIEIMFASKIGS